jgi:hypothetical protein
VWVSLTPRRVTQANPVAVPFPAILDTGHSHSFAISERHLTEWAGLRAEALAVRRAVRDRGRRIVLRQANVWVHVNEAGSCDRLANRSPFQIEAQAGIAVYSDADFPRLPLLGLRVIAENELVLKVAGARREATLGTAYRWWPFS